MIFYVGKAKDMTWKYATLDSILPTGHTDRTIGDGGLQLELERRRNEISLWHITLD